MPSPEQDRTRRVRSPIDPATATADDLLAHLAADPTTGLSPKEAARRLENGEASPLFRKPARRYADCVKKTIREPALWLLLAVAVISLFFDRVALGLVCLLLSVGNTALCAYFLYRADRTDAAMQVAYDTPLCRVLRGGRILRMSAEGLVKGDIILLEEGDIVPADCRLLRTDGFTVTERELNASDTSRPPVRLQKDADILPGSAKDLRLSPVNMAFAGGMVNAGSALGVVVAVGSETHLGGLIGHIPSPHCGKTVTYFKDAAKVLSVYNLCLFCLIIPLTVIGIFTVGDAYEFLDIFLSTLALIAVTLTEHLLAKGCYLASAVRRAAALDRDRENAAEIKSSVTHEKLTAMTDLLLVGTAALHDGGCHPETLRVGERIYRCDRPEADGEARAVAEYLYLYRKGTAALPSAGMNREGRQRLLTAFCEWAEIDEAALEVKIKDIRTEDSRFGETGVSGVFPAAEGNCRVTVILTDRFDAVESCTYVYDGRKSRPADSDGRNALYRVYREAVRQGSTPLFLLVQTKQDLTLRAMLTYAPHTCRKTAGCVKNLESAGVRVTAFLRDVSDSHTRVLAACGLTEQTPADRPVPEGEDRTPAAQRISAGCRAFEGCSQDYILDCIADLKAQGRTVGVLSAEGEDIALLAEADIAFTCVPSLYAAAEAGYGGMEPCNGELSASVADGHCDGGIANDRSRRAAHVLVRRSSSVGGGMLGVLRALQAADGFKDALDRTLRFTLLSQTARTVMTVLPLCLGLAVAAAPTLLLSGLLLDLLVMAAALKLPLRSTPAPRRTLDAGITHPHITHRAELLSAAAGAALPWSVAGISALCGVDFGGDLLYFGLLGTFGLQLAVFLTDRLPRRDSTVFFTTLGLALAYVGGLGAALAAGLNLLWALVLPLSAPASYVILRAILTRILGQGRKGSTPKG